MISPSNFFLFMSEKNQNCFHGVVVITLDFDVAMMRQCHPKSAVRIRLEAVRLTNGIFCPYRNKQLFIIFAHSS